MKALPALTAAFLLLALLALAGQQFQLRQLNDQLVTNRIALNATAKQVKRLTARWAEVDARADEVAADVRADADHYRAVMNWIELHSHPGHGRQGVVKAVGWPPRSMGFPQRDQVLVGR